MLLTMQSRAKDKGAAHVLVSLSILTVLVFVCMVGAVVWLRERTNSLADKEQQLRLTAALDGLKGRHADAISAFGRGLRAANPAASELSAVLRDIRGRQNGSEAFDIVIYRSPGGEAFSLDLRGQSSPAAVLRFMPALERIAGSGSPAESKPESRFVVIGGQAFLAALSPLPQHGAFVAGIKPVDGRMLAEISWRTGASLVDMRSDLPEMHQWSSLPIDVIANADGSPSQLHLVWKGEKPGDRLAAEIAPIFLVMTALFAAWAVFHMRGITGELAEGEQRAIHLAGHDPLTGLPNRLLFSELLQREMADVSETGRRVAVMALDVHRLKEINDNYSHLAGDRVIVAFVERVKPMLADGDVFGRTGGDEFCIMRVGNINVADCETLARRIVKAMQDPIDVDGIGIHTHVAIGIATTTATIRDAAEMLRCADIALLHAKNSGIGRYAFFERRMSDQLRANKQLEVDLRAAIEGNQLEVYYQPVMSADGKTVVGAEALCRWRHAKLGYVPPFEFIKIAEERGLIGVLGDWVLRRACMDARNWRGLHVAVNVSPVQFRQKNFVASIARILEETGFDPANLELELTESAIVSDEDQAEEAMIELRARGVRLALDDFGTGYSSLIYLRRFAFDKIKIDRSFLQSMEATGESAIIVHSVVHLGRALGLTVTAEGIELPEQQRFLQAVGCHELQGYMFAKPLPVKEFEAFLAKHSGSGQEQRRHSA